MIDAKKDGVMMELYGLTEYDKQRINGYVNSKAEITHYRHKERWSEGNTYGAKISMFIDEVNGDTEQDAVNNLLFKIMCTPAMYIKLRDFLKPESEK